MRMSHSCSMVQDLNRQVLQWYIMLQGNFMIIANCRKLLPIRRNSTHFAAFCRNLPQFAPKHRDLPQLIAKRLRCFFGLNPCAPFYCSWKKSWTKMGGSNFIGPLSPPKNNFSGFFLQGRASEPPFHTSILSLIYRTIFSNIDYCLRHAAYKLQESLTFFRSNLIFPALGLISQPKNPCQPPKNTYNINMANLTPSPSLPSLAPHDIARDGSFNRIDSDPLPYGYAFDLWCPVTLMIHNIAKDTCSWHYARIVQVLPPESNNHEHLLKFISSRGKSSLGWKYQPKKLCISIAAYSSLYASLPA